MPRHPHTCISCQCSGRCSLGGLPQALGVGGPRLPGPWGRTLRPPEGCHDPRRPAPRCHHPQDRVGARTTGPRCSGCGGSARCKRWTLACWGALGCRRRRRAPGMGSTDNRGGGCGWMGPRGRTAGGRGRDGDSRGLPKRCREERWVRMKVKSNLGGPGTQPRGPEGIPLEPKSSQRGPLSLPVRLAASPAHRLAGTALPSAESTASPPTQRASHLHKPHPSEPGEANPQAWICLWGTPPRYEVYWGLWNTSHFYPMFLIWILIVFCWSCLPIAFQLVFFALPLGRDLIWISIKGRQGSLAGAAIEACGSLCWSDWLAGEKLAL